MSRAWSIGSVGPAVRERTRTESRLAKRPGVARRPAPRPRARAAGAAPTRLAYTAPMRPVTLALALLLVACGEPAPAATSSTTPSAVVTVTTNHSADPWPSGTARTFSARWSRAGSGWIYDAVLLLRNDGGRVSGQIQWTLVAVDMTEAPYMIARVGASATEVVAGTFHPAEGRVDLEGLSVSDDSLISTDRYQLVLGADGSLAGRTITNSMDWSGSLVGRAR